MRLAPVDHLRHGRGGMGGQRRVEALETAAGVVQMGVAVIEGAAVVGTQEKETQGFGVVLLQHVANGEKVAQTLGHFFIVDTDKTVVHPEACQRLATGTFALGDLVFMVRELQVGAATMDVKVVAQRSTAHGRAFNMPARAPHAEVETQGRAVPFGIGGLCRLGRLPQYKVQRVALAVLHGHALAGTQLIERLARQLAIAVKLAHCEIDIA